MYTLQISSIVTRRLTSTQNSRLTFFHGHCTTHGKLNGYRRRIGFWLREQSTQIVEACTRQFEFIAAQRIRRSIQIFHLYTRLWDEVALKEFMKSWRHRIGKNTRHFLISATGVTMYNWDSERISDEEITNYHQEIDGIYKLRDLTVICATCHLRTIIDVAQPGIQYCTCNGVKRTATLNEDSDGWQPFIERRDMLVWKRQEPDSGGLYAYKVYGSFSDVTAEDFLQTQIDVDYRREWDPSARELQIIETDPKSEGSTDNSTDIVYWEMVWPRLFANRDYVYQRRWIVDKEKGLVIIVSKVTNHPKVPTKPGTYRVTTYWSYMVIRPYKEFHQPGIEFGLTYFDDPGVNVPSTVTAWVAMSGLPDFLIRMREASKNYRNYKMSKDTVDVPNSGTLEALEPEETKEDNETIKEKYVDDKSSELVQSMQNECNIEENESNGNSTNDSTSEEKQGLLHHFFLNKLFA